MICAERTHVPEERFAIAPSQSSFSKKASKEPAQRVAIRLCTDAPVHPHCQHFWFCSLCFTLPNRLGNGR